MHLNSIQPLLFEKKRGAEEGGGEFQYLALPMVKTQYVASLQIL